MQEGFRTGAGVAAAALLAFACTPGAFAQDRVPSYATAPPETIHGTIAAITGKFTLTLNDERGFQDSVTLHDGTVIEPAGVSLAVGQEVTITGKTDGPTFDASEVDTDGAAGYDAAGVDPGAGYAGGLAYGAYPSYVLPMGNGLYYYGNGVNGYYYNSGYGYYTGGRAPGPSAGTPLWGHPVPQPHPPITRVHGPLLPPSHSAGSGGSSHGSDSGSHGSSGSNGSSASHH
jgi:hypothetical protein